MSRVGNDGENKILTGFSVGSGCVRLNGVGIGIAVVVSGVSDVGDN